MMLGALKAMIYVTIKYSQQRMGVSANGLSETPIFDYQLQQNALIPIVSRTLGLNMLHNYAKSLFANQKGHEQEILIVCCVDKVMMGWHAERSISIMRERTGGQGYLGANMFGEAIASTHAGITAEGDNKVLMVKVVKDLLAIHLKNHEYFYHDEFLKITHASDLYEMKTIATLLQMI